MATPINPMASDPTFTAYKIPLSVIVKWPTANYVNPERRQWLAAYGVVWEVLATALLAARLYSRWTKAAGKFGIDDVLIVFGWLFGIVFTGTAVWGVLVGGFDRHVWDVPPLTAEHGALDAWIQELFFTFSTVFAKLSILVFHRRLMTRTTNKYMVWAINGLIVFTIVYLFSFVLFLSAVCSPTNASWKSLNINYNKPYKCADRGIFDPMWGVVSVISDAYAIVLPELLVKRLQISFRQKIVLWVVFGCGITTVVTGIIRTVFLRELSTSSNRDLTWIGYNVTTFTLPECHLALICASAPALKGFFEVYVIAPLSRSKGGTGAFSTWTGTSGKDDGTITMNRSNSLKTAVTRAEEVGQSRKNRPKSEDKQGIIVMTRFSMSSDDGRPVSRGSIDSFERLQQSLPP